MKVLVKVLVIDTLLFKCKKSILECLHINIHIYTLQNLHEYICFSL